MKLSPDFHFNQGNLQDFVDCRRRFWLRHVRQLAWPAVQSEPVLENELHIQRGALFHRLVQQHLLGLPEARLRAMIADEQVAQWWDNYIKDVNLKSLNSLSVLYPEVTLTSRLAGYRLVAKYDLIAVTSESQTFIYDWKTSRQRPKSEWLEKRLQTRLYPYLLARAGAHLNLGKNFEPEQVVMLYWFAGFPEQPQRIAYHTAQYQADERYLTATIDTILSLDIDGFFQTDDHRRCRFCIYRSLCERGEKAGSLDEMEGMSEPQADFDFDLDFEQIGEIEF